MRNTVEKAIKTETDTRTEQTKGGGKFGWFISGTSTVTSPPREGEPAGTGDSDKDDEDGRGEEDVCTVNGCGNFSRSK